MTRRLLTAVLFGLVASLAGCGCGGGGNATPEKATPEMEAAQKKTQDEADEGERKMQPAKKKR